MTKGRGGEPDGARLLALARRELLEDVLPQLQGDARYRARLIANAMKIAAAELGEGEGAEAAAEGLRRIAAGLRVPGRAEPSTDAEVADALSAALRQGAYDGHQGLYDLLVAATGRRRSLGS